MPNYNWISEEIFTVTEFLTPDECAAFIRQAEAAGFEEATISTGAGQKIQKDFRNNDRLILDDPTLAARLWERCTDYIPLNLDGCRAVGVNERFRFYRYDVGQQFDWHSDGAFRRDNGEKSRLTFMIYLNEDFTGGETAFEEYVMVPETGMALFFIHRIAHKGQPVTSGRKYALRTDVMYSAPWS